MIGSVYLSHEPFGNIKNIYNCTWLHQWSKVTGREKYRAGQQWSWSWYLVTVTLPAAASVIRWEAGTGAPSAGAILVLNSCIWSTNKLTCDTQLSLRVTDIYKNAEIIAQREGHYYQHVCCSVQHTDTDRHVCHKTRASSDTW